MEAVAARLIALAEGGGPQATVAMRVQAPSRYDHDQLALRLAAGAASEAEPGVLG
jgi:hypothetical protein